MDKAEKKVSEYYTERGWSQVGEHTEDAQKWEDLRGCAAEYVAQCRRRVLNVLPESGTNILDMASGPIQYPEYLQYSTNFQTRWCIDLSATALEMAEKRIGSHGRFICGSFFETKLENDYFDAAISLHTIYHMDAEKQYEAVLKLINVTKPGGSIVIVYNNPNSILSRISQLRKLLFPKTRYHEDQKLLYFHAHPLGWWSQFEPYASIQILPWRTMRSNIQKMLIPNNKFGKFMLKILFKLEESFPQSFVQIGDYPMIILKKLEDK